MTGIEGVTVEPRCTFQSHGTPKHGISLTAPTTGLIVR